MRRSLIAGLVFAVFAAVIIGLGQLLGLDLQHVALMGAATRRCARTRPAPADAWASSAGFVVGFVLAWIGFALRAALLPDSAGGALPRHSSS